MSLSTHYELGMVAALEKVAGMSIDQAREYVANKNQEKKQDAFYTAAGGVGSGIAEGLADATPISGKMMVLPGAALGFGVSKLKNIYDGAPNMYTRDGKLTGRSYGAAAGGGLGAAAGAGLGHLLDDSGLGMGLGGILGGILGSGVGQEVGDYTTERRSSDVIRQAKSEAMQHKLDLKKKYR